MTEAPSEDLPVIPELAAMTEGAPTGRTSGVTLDCWPPEPQPASQSYCPKRTADKTLDPVRWETLVQGCTIPLGPHGTLRP